MIIKKHIPNALTAMNLIGGCLAIHFAYEGKLDLAGFSIFVSAIFDFADGFAARLLKVKSELGKQLDSLADVISFGVAPAAIMLQMMFLGNQVWEAEIPNWIFLVALMIPVCAALRLAKFNIDERQTDSFIGLPSPATGLLIAAFAVMIFRKYESPICPFNDYVFHFVLHPATLIGVTVSLSLLMLSPLPLFAMKFKSFKWRDNKVRFVFIIASFLLLLLFFFTAIPIVIILYILLSIVLFIFKDKTTKV